MPCDCSPRCRAAPGAAGILVANVRGFTGFARDTEPYALSLLLRRFYTETEAVLFPVALVDKLIGDAVMALYVPMLGRPGDPRRGLVGASGDRVTLPGSASSATCAATESVCALLTDEFGAAVRSNRTMVSPTRRESRP